MDREIIDALFRLMQCGVEDDFFVEVIDFSTNNHGVDWHGSDRHAAVRNDRFAAGIEIAACG